MNEALEGGATPGLGGTAQAAGAELARLWLPGLERLCTQWRDRLPAWDWAFPGLLALLGLQCRLWPHFASAVLGSEEGGGYAYLAPETAGPDCLRLVFEGVNGRVSWVLVSGSTHFEWDTALAVLRHHDVALTLGTLDLVGKVVVSGRAPEQFGRLLGYAVEGEETLPWPVLDCAVVEEVAPQFAQACAPLPAGFAEVVDAARAEILSSSDRAAVARVYGEMAGALWRELQALGLIIHRPLVKRSPLRRLLGLGPRHGKVFEGILALRGDHWNLWKRVSRPPAG
jgi:hypothetical protein